MQNEYIDFHWIKSIKPFNLEARGRLKYKDHFKGNFKFPCVFEPCLNMVPPCSEVFLAVTEAPASSRFRTMMSSGAPASSPPPPPPAALNGLADAAALWTAMRSGVSRFESCVREFTFTLIES